MATQEYIDDLIIVIETAEDAADVLDELIDGQLSYYKEQFSMEEIINMVT
jgi:hypothetical protein